MDDIVALKSVSLFAGLSAHEMAALQERMHRSTFEPGERILRQGDPGDCLHVVVSGSIEITVREGSGRETLLAESGPGAFFGELSLITNEPRSATVRATGSTVTLSLERSVFESFLDSSPHACRALLSELARRLARTSILARSDIRNVNDVEDEQATFGQRIADAFARTVGSWAFIGLQSIVLICYILWNVLSTGFRWDPYPFLLMSLILSFQAAYAAPIIMMSQNRQSLKDRLTAASNHEVNVKASIDVGRILERLDEIETLLLQGELQASSAQPRSGHDELALPAKLCS